MLTAVKYLKPVGLGVTSPQLFLADDGAICVVKLQNNRLGPKVLVNELIAARFGALINLCFPPADVIEISNALIKKHWQLYSHGVPAGVHFACRYLPGAHYVTRDNLPKAQNKEQMAGVILFDHLFHNPDRTLNRRNLLICREGKQVKLYAIDNSHLFQRGVWSLRSLNSLVHLFRPNYYRSYRWLLKYFLTDRSFAPYVEKINLLTPETLAGLVAEIPQEWLPSEKERAALEAYIIARCAIAGKIAAKLSELIPDDHRSADIYEGV